MELLLYRIQKLFSYDLLDGDFEDNCKYPEGQSPPAMNGKQPRLLIDAIIETICKCSEDRDSLVQLEVIKVSNLQFELYLKVTNIVFSIVTIVDYDCREFKSS